MILAKHCFTMPELLYCPFACSFFVSLRDAVCHATSLEAFGWNIVDSGRLEPKKSKEQIGLFKFTGLIHPASQKLQGWTRDCSEAVATQSNQQERSE